jgi:fengycin family lipopeptide synthetase D
MLGMENERIGIDDNYFELGGHSLKATLMVSKIHKEFNVDTPLAQIFDFPTIRGLAQIIKGLKEVQYAALEAVEKKEYYSLSSAQKRTFILHQMDTESISYNLPVVRMLSGDLDKKKLADTFRKLIQRHQSLRTSFIMIDEEPVQKIHKQADFEIEYYCAERKAQSAERKEGRYAPGAMRYASTIKKFIRPFDLSHPPLIRVGLIEIEKNKHILMIDMYHIISDATSMGIMQKEYMSLYQGNQLPELRIQYKDYAEWQQSPAVKESEKNNQQGKYWLAGFGVQGEIPILHLPTDFPRPAVQRFEGNSLTFELDSEKTDALKTLAFREKATLYMVLLGICNIFFSKLSGQDHIIIGTPVSGRSHADTHSIIGMFVNTLAIRNYPRGEKTFRQFLGEVKKNTLAAFENQDYPFEDLVEKAAVNRDMSRNPLFDVMFELQNVERHVIEIPGLKSMPYEFDYGMSKFDLVFQALEIEDTVFFITRYCTSLFKHETIQRYLNYFKEIVNSIINDADREISQVDMVPAEEKKQILFKFNNTRTNHPIGKAIQQMFAEQVERTPANIALFGPSARKYRTYMTDMTYISYRELNEESNQLAVLLREQGVKPDTIVGIMAERSVEMLVGILGILKADGAYLPIDPEYPEDRVKYMMEDSAAKILLTSDAINRVPTPHQLSFHPSNLLPFYPSQSSKLAYVIYTSGSTGRPRGVMVEHGNVNNLVLGLMERVYQKYDNLLKVALVAPFVFDASVKQIFAALLQGHCLNIVPEDVRLDGEKLIEFYNTYCIDISDSTPTHLYLMAESSRGRRSSVTTLYVKHFLVGGEVLSRKTVELFSRCFAASAPLVTNVYGPTECCVDSTALEVSAANINSYHTLPIGTPMANQQIYIMNKINRLQPIGIPGELCISGANVSRGYLNNPELTAEKFCLRRPGGALFVKTAPPGPPRKNFLLEGPDKDHMQSCNHAAMQPCSYETMQLSPHHSPHYPTYLTGDLARWLPDGNIEFLGRMDHQVKIRGFRIELEEIESHLLAHHAINEAVVMAWQDKTGDNYLCAYVTSEKEISIPGTRDHLSKRLPGYMIPSYFVQLEEIPLTPSGKVNRKALPTPGVTPGGEHAAPRNELEKKLVEIWSEVLGVEIDKIGIDDNFFQLGGHSLKATIVVSRIHREFEVKIPMVEIFKTPFIRALALKIIESAPVKFLDLEEVEKKEYYETSYNQKRLWIIYCMAPDSSSYNMPGMIRLDHVVNIEALKKAFSRIFKRHESFRTGFKEIHNQTVQFIRDSVEIPFRVIDISGMPDAEKQEKTGEIIRHTTLRPFDLQRPPLFRSVLIKQNSEDFVLVYNMHHIISDGWSMGILRNELNQLYDDYLKGKNPSPEPVQFRYKDFAHWHNRQIRDPGYREQAHHYWQGVLESGLPTLKLPYYRTENHQERTGNTYRCVIKQTVKDRLQRLAIQDNIPLFTVLFTLYNLLLAYLSGETEIVTTVISAGRQHPSLHTIVGYFINPVIVKTHVDLDKDFKDLLTSVNTDVLEAFQHQHYPLELVSQEMEIPYPDVSTAFNLLNMQDISTAMELDSLEPYHSRGNKEVKFHMVLYLTEYKNGIEINWEYQKSLFKPKTIEEIANKYLLLMDEITSDESLNDRDQEDEE